MHNLWDKKSNKYQRFAGQTSEFQKRILSELAALGVSFKGKSVVDIGCGTGVWTLLIAKEAARVTGVDNSGGMLEILRKDARKFGISNVETIEKSWDEFKTDEVFDVAITTMSPALRDERDFERFSALGRLKIYLGWAAPRTSDLLEPFFERYGRKTANFMLSSKLEAWLTARDVKFSKKNFSETRVVRRDAAEALENVCWHLDINALKYDVEDVEAMLAPFCEEGFVNETINSQMTLFTF